MFITEMKLTKCQLMYLSVIDLQGGKYWSLWILTSVNIHFLGPQTLNLPFVVVNSSLLHNDIDTTHVQDLKLHQLGNGEHHAQNT